MRPRHRRPASPGGSFHIGFDAPNTLAMYLVGEELRSRARSSPLVHLGQLPPASKDRLRGVYRLLAAALPDDPAAPRYLAMLDQSLGLAGEPPNVQAVIAGARTVLQAVTEAARKPAIARQTPLAFRQTAGRRGRRSRRHPGKAQWRPADRILPPPGRCRRSAVAAGSRPRGILARFGRRPGRFGPAARGADRGNLWQQIESDSERAERLAVLGTPTMQTRHDLTQHFAVSAALVVLVGPQGGKGIGVLKELSDSRGGRGLSFVDLSADLSGILFASAIPPAKSRLLGWKTASPSPTSCPTRRG